MTAFEALLGRGYNGARAPTRVVVGIQRLRPIEMPFRIPVLALWLLAWGRDYAITHSILPSLRVPSHDVADESNHRREQPPSPNTRSVALAFAYARDRCRHESLHRSESGVLVPQVQIRFRRYALLRPPLLRLRTIVLMLEILGLRYVATQVHVVLDHEFEVRPARELGAP